MRNESNFSGARRNAYIDRPTRIFRRVLQVTAIGGVFAFLGYGFIPPKGCGTSGEESKAMSEARQVGIALKMFATENQGKLPDKLAQLYPDYLFDESIKQIDGMGLTMPGATLDGIPTDYVIAWKLIPKHSDRIVVVHPDIAVEIVRDRHRAKR